MSSDARAYRLRLRATEAACAALTATLTNLQRRGVEAVADGLGVTADAIFAVADLEALIGEDGRPDPAAIAAAADTARDRFGIPTRNRAGLAGLASGAMRPPPAPDRFTNAFKPEEKK